MPSTSHSEQSSRLGWKIHVAPYLQTEGSGTLGGSAPFRCPNSELNTGFVNQEAGTAYNINLGDDRFNNYPAIKINEISSPVETGVIADSIDGTDWAAASRLRPSENGVGYRHNSGLNLLWADGHSQWFSTVTIQAGKDGAVDWYYEVIKP